MAGALITGKIEDKGALAALKAIADRAGDMRPAWRLIGETVMASILKNFREKRSPSGTPWAQHAKSTARARSKKGYSAENVLIMKNRLMRSIHPTVAADSVTIGTNVVYAAIHQFGGTISVGGRSQTLAHGKSGKLMSRKAAGKKKTGSTRVSFASIGPHTITIPARPFLGVRDEDWPRIAKDLQRYLVSGRV